MNRIKTQPLNQWAGSSIPVAVTLISEQVCPPCRSCRRKNPSPVIIGSRLRAVKLGHLVARVTVEFSSPLSNFSHFRSSPHSPFIASAEQHHPLSPPTPDKINYIPLQWYHQVLLLVIENMSDCRVFYHHEAPCWMERPVCLLVCGIPLSYSIELWLSYSVMGEKRDCYLCCFFLVCMVLYSAVEYNWMILWGDQWD